MQYLVDGAKVVLSRIFYRTIGAKMGLQPPPNLFRDKDKMAQPKDKGKKGKKTKAPTEAKEEVTLTQITKKYEFVGQDAAEAEASEEQEEIHRRFLSPLIMVQSVRVRELPLCGHARRKDLMLTFYNACDLQNQKCI